MHISDPLKCCPHEQKQNRYAVLDKLESEVAQAVFKRLAGHTKRCC